jgi:branched-chain amino acid transport system permease protein
MSAAYWRRAMNAGPGAAGRAAPRVAASTRLVAQAPAPDPYAHSDAPRWLKFLWSRLSARHVFVFLGVLVYPFFASSFFTYQIGAQALALGLIALSLTLLAGFGGMVSLAQMTVAGMAGYLVAIFGHSAAASISLGWPWWVAVPFAVVLAVVFATVVGWLSVRTEGIYTIMITLAIGVALFYLAQQNYTLFNGHQGFNQVFAPTIDGLDFRKPVPFYYLTLACALAGYFFVKHLVRTPFGVALQGIRDNPRRMHALGFHVTAHRVAAYALAGLLAAVGGVLITWYNNRISPGSMGIGVMINILIIAVLGGIKHPIGAFIGAILFVLLQNFAIDLVDRERFNLVIGGVFLVIVLFSPDGLLGLWAMLRSRLGPQSPISNPRRQP